jgi:hypothetical protein
MMTEDHVMNDDKAHERTVARTPLSPLFPINELLALEITVAIMPLFKVEDIQINHMPKKIRRIVLDALHCQYPRIAQTDGPMIEDQEEARPLSDEEWTRQLDEMKLSDFVEQGYRHPRTRSRP